MPEKSAPTEGPGDTQLSSGNYITIVPVEYPRSNSRTYMVDQYNRTGNNCDEYNIHNEYGNNDVNNSQSTLYTVSQRLPPTTPGGGYSNLNNSDWDRDQGQSSSDTTKDTNSEVLSDKQPTPGSNSSTASQQTSTSPSSSSSHPSSGSATDNVTSESTTASVGRSAGSSSPPQLQQQASFSSVPTCVYLMSRVALYMDIEDAPNATAAHICSAIVNSEELGLNKTFAEKIFTLWMCSPLLEVQLRPSHKPLDVRKGWRVLLAQYSHGTLHQQQRDEPRITFQRNVFSKHPEEKIKDQRILELLYDEAKYNILEGRYPCEPAHYIMLGAIQAKIELGPYNPQLHSIHYFREEQRRFLPPHVRKSSTWTWLPISSKNSAEVRLLEQFKRIPTSATNRKLIRKYLEFCWSLPYYGAAFFQGQVEQPVRGLTSLMTHQDIPVLIAINSQGIYIIDDIQCTVLLGLRYEEMSWDYAKPSREDNPDCLPCLFVQFTVLENGTRVSKILQVFSRQAVMMDTIISGFVDDIKKKKSASAAQLLSGDELDRAGLFDSNADSDDTHMPLTMGGNNRRDTPQSYLSNKLSRLTLSTFDEDGHCIGQMGSWSFGY